MIRVWLTYGFWASVAHDADPAKVRPDTRAGARIRLAASAGGIEWLRQRASATALLAFEGVGERLVDLDPSAVRCAQLALAALSRLGWRPVLDDESTVFDVSLSDARVDARVVPRIRCAWLQELRLRPGVPERAGSGSRALREVVAWAESQGAEVIRLVSPKRTVGFWLRHGFVVAGVDAGGDTRMVRELAPGGADGPQVTVPATRRA